MSRAERVILTNMCMVYDGDRILVQNKVNDDWTGLCFPGGDCLIIMTAIKLRIRAFYIIKINMNLSFKMI